MNECNIAIIVEGSRYEPTIIESIKKHFFITPNNKGIKLITLPADQNIYMLYLRYKEYKDENVDIIELIRDFSPITKKALQEYKRNDFGEVYLFMDLDKHQNNLPKNINQYDVIEEMFKTFNNETENGKLYISYPMAEAIGDYYNKSCLPLNSKGKCFVSSKYKNYKDDVTKSTHYKQISEYTLSDWANILRVFRQRLSCLLKENKVLNFDECKKIDSLKIFVAQEDNDNDKIVVLSAFPEFIIDYFRIEKLIEIIDKY